MQRQVVKREDVGKRDCYLYSGGLRTTDAIPTKELQQAINDVNIAKVWQDTFRSELSFRKYGYDRTQCYKTSGKEDMPLWRLSGLRLNNVLKLISRNKHRDIRSGSDWHSILTYEANLRTAEPDKEGDLAIDSGVPDIATTKKEKPRKYLNFKSKPKPTNVKHEMDGFFYV